MGCLGARGERKGPPPSFSGFGSFGDLCPPYPLAGRVWLPGGGLWAEWEGYVFFASAAVAGGVGGAEIVGVEREFGVVGSWVVVVGFEGVGGSCWCLVVDGLSA